MLKIGHNIAFHKAPASDPVMDGYAAARDKLASHAYLILNGLPLHFHYHHSVIRLVIDVEGFSPGYPEFVLLFLFHAGPPSLARFSPWFVRLQCFNVTRVLFYSFGALLDYTVIVGDTSIKYQAHGDCQSYGQGNDNILHLR
jgi:hypothetical protein